MRTTIALSTLGLLAAVPAAAAPTVTFASGSGITAPGTIVFQNFDSFASGAALPGSTNAFAFGSTNDNGARPAFGSTGNFASVLQGGSYAVSFGPSSLFSFVLGSLDTFNTVTLSLVGGGTATFAGGQIINGVSFPAGDKSAVGSNGVVTFNAGSGPLINGVLFSSDGRAFEFDNLATGNAAVPEPATWALLLMGFGAVGYALRRRGARVRIAA